MNENNNNPVPIGDSAGREIVLSRTFDAPRELVWRAMTNPQHVIHWWGPRGFTTTIETMDVRPGGVWSHIMRGPDGTEYPNHCVFIEVVEPKRISFANSGGSEGKTDVQFESTWTFDTVDERQTKVTIRMVFPSAAARDLVVNEYGAIEGGKQCLERLGEHVEKIGPNADRAIIITRRFDAPCELVWQAWTDPQQFVQWWGPRGFTNPVCELDVQPGGIWRVVMRSPEGVDYAMKSVYVKVEPPTRLVYVMDCSDHPIEWHDVVNPNRDKSLKPRLECVQTVTFEDLGGKTKLTIRMDLESAAIRDAMVKMGANEGWSGSLDKLRELLMQFA
jgi:uncharacterized protein YndB with AHSA1/START domain